jgi:hypothetical protein
MYRLFAFPRLQRAIQNRYCDYPYLSPLHNICHHSYQPSCHPPLRHDEEWSVSPPLPHLHHVSVAQLPPYCTMVPHMLLLAQLWCVGGAMTSEQKQQLQELSEWVGWRLHKHNFLGGHNVCRSASTSTITPLHALIPVGSASPPFHLSPANPPPVSVLKSSTPLASSTSTAAMPPHRPPREHEHQHQRVWFVVELCDRCVCVLSISCEIQCDVVPLSKNG